MAPRDGYYAPCRPAATVATTCHTPRRTHRSRADSLLSTTRGFQPASSLTGTAHTVPRRPRRPRARLGAAVLLSSLMGSGRGRRRTAAGCQRRACGAVGVRVPRASAACVTTATAALAAEVGLQLHAAAAPVPRTLDRSTVRRASAPLSCSSRGCHTSTAAACTTSCTTTPKIWRLLTSHL